MEVAFCDFREDNVKSIHNTQEVIPYEIETKPKKLSAKEEVCQPNLQA
jgi:hypothetical protein